MKKLLIATVLMVCLIPVAGLAQTFYTENFEGIAPVDGSMAGAGWYCYNNYFDATATWYWGGPFDPIVNNVGNICDIVGDQGGPNQDLQQLVVYNNYWDGAHQNPGHIIETNVYQQFDVVAGSGVWYFTFDAKLGNIAAPSSAFAFIKVLNPATGWSTTAFITEEMTNISTTWQDYELTVDLTGLAGQVVQIGFLHNSIEYSPAGVFYDNLAFSPDGTVANENKSWSEVKSLYQ